jgi:ABC-type multidrug transport system ATPase subunit
MVILYFLCTGSVTIYNQTVSEMDDSDAVLTITGVCPQSNVQFGFLTVRENLRLFAKIKGILPHEVEQEVCEQVHGFVTVEVKLAA